MMEQRVEHLVEMVEELLRKADPKNAPGEPGHPLTIKTGGFEWMKLFIVILFQTAALVMWGTHLVDNHDARITNVENKMSDYSSSQKQTNDVVNQTNATVIRIDERTKNLESSSSQRFDRIEAKLK